MPEADKGIKCKTKFFFKISVRDLGVWGANSGNQMVVLVYSFCDWLNEKGASYQNSLAFYFEQHIIDYTLQRLSKKR